MVKAWLLHEDITNLKLTAISDWHNNETIKTFLAESTLADEGDLQGDGNRQGLRLRIDLCRASGGPKSCRGGRPSKRVPSGASAWSTDSTPAPTPPANSTAPLRVSLLTRIQLYTCGADTPKNRAAADGAVELLDSLNSRETRLLVVLGHGHPGLSDSSKLVMMLYAVIDLEPTCVVCISPDAATVAAWG